MLSHLNRGGDAANASSVLLYIFHKIIIYSLPCSRSDCECRIPPKWVEIVAMRLVFIYSQEVLKHLVGEVELLIDILFKDILDSQLQWEWLRELIVCIISED